MIKLFENFNNNIITIYYKYHSAGFNSLADRYSNYIYCGDELILSDYFGELNSNDLSNLFKELEKRNILKVNSIKLSENDEDIIQQNYNGRINDNIPKSLEEFRTTLEGNKMNLL